MPTSAAPAINQPRRGQNYNYPLAWYRRPDGDIVQLQSDPNNRTFYEDLGFVMLRPPEVHEWLDVVRPNVVAEQKKRAAADHSMIPPCFFECLLCGVRSGSRRRVLQRGYKWVNFL